MSVNPGFRGRGTHWLMMPVPGRPARYWLPAGGEADVLRADVLAQRLRRVLAPEAAALDAPERRAQEGSAHVVVDEDRAGLQSVGEPAGTEMISGSGEAQEAGRVFAGHLRLVGRAEGEGIEEMPACHVRGEGVVDAEQDAVDAHHSDAAQYGRQ
jgi:hypothetical protein